MPKIRAEMVNEEAWRIARNLWAQFSPTKRMAIDYVIKASGETYNREAALNVILVAIIEKQGLRAKARRWIAEAQDVRLSREVEAVLDAAPRA